MADPASAETVPTAPKKIVKKKKSEVNPVSKPADSGFGSTENVHSAPDSGSSAAARRSSGNTKDSTESTSATGDGNNETTSSSRRGSQQQPTSPPQRKSSSVVEPSSPPAPIAEEQVENSFNSNITSSETEKITSAQRRKSSLSLAPIESELPLNVDPNADKISREELINYRIACDSLIKDLQDRLSHEEDAAANLSSNKKKLEGDISNLKKEIENLELALQKVIIEKEYHL